MQKISKKYIIFLHSSSGYSIGQIEGDNKRKLALEALDIMDWASFNYCYRRVKRVE
ncbi:hypothetical protein [Lactococcus allomyrinae]|uniref:hypothetical protein n=1 Tax=Lactococcus allomyrinae TaxID=2419773 RepID=UPI0013C52421|nr:hypothetical protein [Lactococcus allomyrinae]